MRVTVTVYDVRGALVRTIIDQPVGVGHHSVVWDGTDGGGSRVGSGVYFYRLRAGNKVITKKLVVVK
jgi:flagellar hook assembly protein FlgD